MSAEDVQPVFSQLSGLSVTLVFENRINLVNAIMHLSLCEEHEGVHHYAVTGDGHDLSTSECGLACLQRAGAVGPVKV